MLVHVCCASFHRPSNTLVLPGSFIAPIAGHPSRIGFSSFGAVSIGNHASHVSEVVGSNAAIAAIRSADMRSRVDELRTPLRSKCRTHTRNRSTNSFEVRITDWSLMVDTRDVPTK